MYAQIPRPKPVSTSVRNPVSSANCCTLKFSKAFPIARSPSVEWKKSSEQPGEIPYTQQEAASIVPEASSAIDFEISITHTSILFLFLSPSRPSIRSFVFLRLTSAHVRRKHTYTDTHAKRRAIYAAVENEQPPFRGTARGSRVQRVQHGGVGGWQRVARPQRSFKRQIHNANLLASFLRPLCPSRLSTSFYFTFVAQASMLRCE